MTPQNAATMSGTDKLPNRTRFLGWSILFVMFVFLANNFATYWGGLPGAGIDGGPLGLMQLGLYPLAIVFAFELVRQNAQTTLRQDSETISNMNAFFVRACFFIVLYIGIVDTVVSFLRVEQLLDDVVGTEMTKQLGRSQFRGVYIHFPLMILGVITAIRSRVLGVEWLALMVVVAELLIVFLRFIFSYEQAFMADLVRFWYGALFLFASAYTLMEEGHVRVDIFYAGFRNKTKGWVNAFGSLFMGIALCWTILIVGMGSKNSIINSPLLNFETTQSGFGLYVKYLMAGFLGVFAVSMMIQFISYLMAAVADYRGHEGKTIPEGAGAH
ncbi:TRAP transporter small permease subunit [Amylibacter sp. SFDW26]|uniref:TRAP transporter small permease subunit n=1 Tax=Amylibacter sp. SFDW26 TaxID=2652722 RepID=UPI001261D817|nr:TRAP transporter small permease subunit [Amylibacter sp. SFDW26]KAB7615261.1 TRAP transporter small permease subunit [Amylibacter sp. SFDW26]